ncbi:hypothetical protein [Photobacterium leiognathi]|uniref:hypothetical protein n=1 Tax=Photobacterium leiognathi TaxID=553611 RepID=UPI0029824EFA|nr:hypothetical protein [Photobacterium leiognathi]
METIVLDTENEVCPALSSAVRVCITRNLESLKLGTSQLIVISSEPSLDSKVKNILDFNNLTVSKEIKNKIVYLLIKIKQ